jgi:hypothetical protein
VDAIVDPGQRTLEVPFESKPVVFILFEPLELLDEEELEFDGNP